MMARVRETYPDLSRDGQIEEAIAQDFAEWGAKNASVTHNAAKRNATRPRGIHRLYRRILDFLRRLTEWVAGKSSQYQDIFDAIERGEIGARPATRAPSGPVKETNVPRSESRFTGFDAATSSHSIWRT